MNNLPRVPALIVPALCLLELCSQPALCDETADAAPVRFSQVEVREDLSYLYETLEATSYDLFRKTSKSEFDEAYDRLYASVSAPLTALEVNRQFQPFVALAGFSHCKIGFPSDAYQQWYKNGGLFFPLEIAFSNDRALVTANWSDAEAVKAGHEILSINGEDISDVLQKLYAFISGENDYSRRTLLELGSFGETWWYAFGDFDEGVIRTRNERGEVADAVLSGISIAEYYQKSKSVQLPQFVKDGREFRFIDDVAYLRPGIFLNIESNDISSQETFKSEEFLNFIDKAFADIAVRNPGSLILDIRGNNGGDNSFSDPMIAYFANKPFRIASRFSVRTSELTKRFWREVDIPGLEKMKEQILTLPDGARFEAALGEYLPRSDDLAYRGNVYVLTDRFSFSNAAVVAAIVQDYGFGYLIGEETSYVPSSCSAIHTFTLPHSRQTVVYAKACSVRPNGDTEPHGVIPDYLVTDDLFTESDEILKKALEFANDPELSSQIFGI